MFRQHYRLQSIGWKAHQRVTGHIYTLVGSPPIFGSMGVGKSVRTPLAMHYPIISYRKINFYRVETMDIRISHWNNGVSWTGLISISTMLLIVRDKILW